GFSYVSNAGSRDSAIRRMARGIPARLDDPRCAGAVFRRACADPARAVADRGDSPETAPWRFATRGVKFRVNPFAVSNDLLNEPAALRAQMAEEGYLFFRGLGPKDRIAAAGRDVLALCQEAGWCDGEGKWSGTGPFTEGEKEYMDVYKRVIKLPSFL